MSRINIDDDDEVQKYITAALKPGERKVLTFTPKDETDILASLPCDVQLGKSQPRLFYTMKQQDFSYSYDINND
jgi:hypothetical protein